MVTISVTKNGTTVSVEKAVEASVRKFLTSHDNSYETRINGWLKDFNIGDMQLVAQRVKLHRNLTEKEASIIDIEVIGQAMRDIMMSFIDFVKSLMRESEAIHAEPTNAEDIKPIKKFFHMEETETGLSIEGTINPMAVVAAILTIVKEAICDENDKDN